MQPMTTCNLTNNSLCISSTISIVFPPQFKLLTCSDSGLRLVHKHLTYRSPQLSRNISSSEKLRAVNGQRRENFLSSWDDKPYEMLTDEERIYFDEQDVVAFLDPPKELIPLDPKSYNSARYLWKKIDDIPAERRYRLLSLLSPRLISRIWGIAGTRYDDSKLVKRSASNFLFDGDDKMSPEFWKCRTSGGPWPIGWIDFFKKAIFRKGGQTYGRLLVGGPVLSGIADSISPLYFTIRKLTEVMSTEQPCDFAYEFGDGLLDLEDYPQGFPKAVKHHWPFNDHVVMYVRHVGPGVLVGQAWQEGKELEQVPKKLCGEILMVKDYSTS